MLASKEGKGGFLGGMHSVVNVTGGTVTLDKNSVLGMTEEQQTALKNYYTSNNMRLENFCKINISKGTVEGEAGESDTNGGSISAPYGNVMISGAETTIKFTTVWRTAARLLIFRNALAKILETLSR